MSERYDVVIVGGGIGGLMCAYGLSESDPKLRVLLLERGRDIDKRICPIVSKKTKTCLKCDPCAIMEGMAGAGAFSDGKYIISTEYGGWLPDLFDNDLVMRYILKADEILMRFGADKDAYEPSIALKKECLKYDLHMQSAKVKHLGTDANYLTMSKLIEHLKNKVEIVTSAKMTDVDIKTNTVTYIKDYKEESVQASSIVLALGRAGASDFKAWAKKNDLALVNNQVDIGVRVELPYEIWEDFSKVIYEPKIKYATRGYHDTVRMFCFNERGQVVTENTDGILTVNGHAYKDETKKSKNSNFALLSTTNFTSPFNEPIEYAKSVASLANKISGGSVIVQRLGDLRNGKRTDEKRLKESSVIPTLDAVPGDLSLCMPKRQLDNIIETLDALSQVAPGTNNYDTLLYGVECKYYSARPEATDFMITGTSGIYALGDGAGFTRSLSQAGASGLMVASKIVKGVIQ